MADDVTHCRDCCCARSWKALGITSYTGKSIPEHIEQLRTVLERYMFAYPAFRMKPIGAPGSPARIESERLMALEEAARAALGSPNTSTGNHSNDR
jgi:hypothetical protein